MPALGTLSQWEPTIPPVARGRTYQSPAILIRVLPFGETSQIVHLATPCHGMVAALAKGAHRPGPAFQGGLALCTAGEAQLLRRPGGELELLRRFRIGEDLRGLRRSLPRFYAASYVIELLRQWMRPALANAALFRAALTALRALAATSASGVPAWTAWFEARALAATGHRPRLESCAVCGSILQSDILFSAEAGGVVHPACAPAGPLSRIDAAQLDGLIRLYTARLSELGREPPSATSIAAARSVHDIFIPFVLERRPRALGLLERRAVTRP